MSQFVLPWPPAQFPPVNDLRAALPVKGPDQWQRMANAALWLLGRGSQLVTCGPVEGWIDINSERGYEFYIWPHAQAYSRLWLVTLIGDTRAGASGTFEVDGTTRGAWSLPPVPFLGGTGGPFGSISTPLSLNG